MVFEECQGARGASEKVGLVHSGTSGNHWVFASVVSHDSCSGSSSSALIISNTVAERFDPPPFFHRTGSGRLADTEMLLFPSRGQEFRIFNQSKHLVCDPPAGDAGTIFCHTSSGKRLMPNEPLLFLEWQHDFGSATSDLDF